MAKNKYILLLMIAFVILLSVKNIITTQIDRRKRKDSEKEKRFGNHRIEQETQQNGIDLTGSSRYLDCYIHKECFKGVPSAEI